MSLSLREQEIYDAIMERLTGGASMVSNLTPVSAVGNEDTSLPVVNGQGELVTIFISSLVALSAQHLSQDLSLWAGAAIPSTNPGTSPYNKTYLACVSGTYANFPDSGSHAIVLDPGEVALIRRTSTGWVKETLALLNKAYALEAADNANQVAQNVNEWFGADDAHGIRKTWKDWFSDTLATGVRKIWDLWFTNARLDWNNWFGATVAAGIRKTWSDWFEETQFARTVLLRELAAYNDRLKNLEVPFYDEGSGKVVFPVTDGVTYNENTGYLTLSNDYCDLLGVYYNEDTGFIDIGVANETVSGNEE